MNRSKACLRTLDQARHNMRLSPRTADKLTKRVRFRVAAVQTRRVGRGPSGDWCGQCCWR